MSRQGLLYTKRNMRNEGQNGWKVGEFLYRIGIYRKELNGYSRNQKQHQLLKVFHLCVN